MCQMCDEYENELVRMGLIEDARAFREERQKAHRPPDRKGDKLPASEAPSGNRGPAP